MTSRQTGPWIISTLWVIALVAWGATTITLWRVRHVQPFDPPSPLAMVDTIMTYEPTALARGADSVIASDVFRFERHPTHVPFGTPPVAAAPPTTPPRPQVTFGGILGGPPWRAILNGVPNHDESVVVAPGDTIGGLRIRKIRHDTVIVQGRDTVWTFTVRH